MSPLIINFFPKIGEFFIKIFITLQVYINPIGTLYMLAKYKYLYFPGFCNLSSKKFRKNFNIKSCYFSITDLAVCQTYISTQDLLIQISSRT